MALFARRGDPFVCWLGFAGKLGPAASPPVAKTQLSSLEEHRRRPSGTLSRRWTSQISFEDIFEFACSLRVLRLPPTVQRRSPQANWPLLGASAVSGRLFVPLCRPGVCREGVSGNLLLPPTPTSPFNGQERRRSSNKKWMNGLMDINRNKLAPCRLSAAVAVPENFIHPLIC